jgi:eukaryotic-like serine/threonine-protein kinase
LKVAARRREQRKRGASTVRGLLAERRLVAWVLGVGVGAFVVGYILTTLLFFPGFGGDAIVAVPDLRGMPEAQARRTMDRLGLEVELGDPMPNPRVPAGAVLMQFPLPGEEVARGSSVRITLSSGAEVRAIPDLDGMTVDEARGHLERMGWTVRVTEVEDMRAAGTILEVRPASGQTLAVGETVELMVSSGPPRVAVPEVTGFTTRDAVTRLEAEGLRLGQVGYEPFSSAPVGTVISQSPAPGDSLRMGAGVRIVVSGYDPSPPPPPPEEEAAEDEEPFDEEPR